MKSTQSGSASTQSEKPSLKLSEQLSAAFYGLLFAAYVAMAAIPCYDGATTTLLSCEALLSTLTTIIQNYGGSMADQYKLLIEIRDDEDEGLDYISKLIEACLLEELPDGVTFELTEYEDA